MVVATGWWRRTAGSSPTATRASTAPPAACGSTSPSSAWRPPPTATATGWSPRTAGSSASATRTSGGRWEPSPQPARRGHGGHGIGQRVLAGRRGRRHLLLRRRALPRLGARRAQAGREPQQADRWHRRGDQRRRLPLGRGGRRDLHLRLRAVLGLAGGRGAPAPHRGGGGDLQRQRVLVHRLAGPGLELRRRPVRRISAPPARGADRRHVRRAWQRLVPGRNVSSRRLWVRRQRLPVRGPPGGSPSDRDRAGRRSVVRGDQPVPRPGSRMGGRRAQPLHLLDLRHVGDARTGVLQRPGLQCGLRGRRPRLQRRRRRPA